MSAPKRTGVFVGLGCLIFALGAAVGSAATFFTIVGTFAHAPGNMIVGPAEQPAIPAPPATP